MSYLLYKLGRWLMSKIMVLVVIWVIAILGVAIWLMAENYLESIPTQVRELETAIAQKEQVFTSSEARQKELTAAIAKLKDNEEIRELSATIAEYQAEIDSKWERAKAIKARIDETNKALKKLNDAWEKIIKLFKRGHKDPEIERLEKLKANDEKLKALYSERISDLRASQATFKQNLGEIKQQVDAALAEHQKLLNITRDRVDSSREMLLEDRGRLADLRSREKARNEEIAVIKHYASEALNKMLLTLVILSATLILGPIIWKIFLYYLWAPLMSIARPVLLGDQTDQGVHIGESTTAVSLEVKHGEVVTLKPDFYQATDLDLSKKTRFLYSWRYPLTSMASRMYMMTEVRSLEEGRTQRLTLSSQTKIEKEVCVIELDENASIICRPSFLVAVISLPGSQVRLKSHWRLFHLHAWLTMQFRYFEFQGPGKLVLQGARGIRAECLHPAKGSEPAVSRITNRNAMVGFSPGLEYNSQRAETFWAYANGANPLFDDKFTGQGVILCQQVSVNEEGAAVSKFWNTFFSGIGKVFGL